MCLPAISGNMYKGVIEKMRATKTLAKRLLSILLILILTLSMALAGCGKSGKSDSDSRIEEDDDDDDSSSKKKKKKDKDSDEDKKGKSGKSDDVEGLYYAAEMIMGDQHLSCLESGMTPANTSLKIEGDGKAKLTIGGVPNDFEIKDGKMCAFGQALYDLEIVSADEVLVDMNGVAYRFLRKDSELAAAEGLVEGATAAPRKNSRHLMYGEKELEVDGGVLYYEVLSDEVYISYGNVVTKDLYIPAEIEEKPVTNIRRLHGSIENLYLPSSLVKISSSFGDFADIKTLTFGYDGGEFSLKYFKQCTCDYSHFKRDNLEKVVFPESAAENEDLLIGCCAFGESYNLKEVVGKPPQWQIGTDSLNKGAAMLGKPSSYIRPQSDKVTELTKEVTKGLNTDSEKVYAICKWVVNNVVYDQAGYSKYLAARDAKYYGADYKPDDLAMNSVATFPDEVIDKKVAVCEGFSRLTRAMCNAAGIPAVLVVGVLPPKKEQCDMCNWHAWNMVYFDGEWHHIDTTFCNKDYNALVLIDEDQVDTDEGAINYEIVAQESTITYEQYMANEELQENYTWEEIQEINKYNEDTQGFDGRHYYYCLPAEAMGADHIAYYIDDMEIPGVEPVWEKE